MDKKLYYKDPLAAAYMAREFGVKIQFATWWTDDFDDIISEYNEGEIFPSKLYIHPDSYHIFEPHVGDVASYYFGKQRDIYHGVLIKKDDKVFATTFHGHQKEIGTFWEVSREIEKIIQRNNKPFFIP